MDHPILELNLDSRAAGSIRAALHLWLPDRPEQTIAHDIPVALDLTQLRELSLTNDAYGQALTTMVFADSRLLQGWQEAYKHLIGFSTPIRFRIAYSPDADMLHGLRWELLEDPLSQLHVPLALSERLLFSRFLKVTQYDPPPRRLSHPLRALVIVANPHGLERYNLTPIDGQREVDLVRRALPGIDVTALRSDLGDQPVTLNAIEYSLRTHREVVYLLAHGRLSTSEAALWLESDDGTIDLVKASDIVHMVRGVRPSPLLMVLASCQSAGDDEGGALVALGPQLVLAGVPAVLAMHGTINQSTLEHLLPIFFDRLRRHGQIDEALAAARNFVQRQAHEWWKPVLFLGTHRGRLWSADTLRTANLGPQQPYISQAVTLSSALEDFAQIQPDMLLQIDTEALSVQSVFPIQRNDNVLIYSLRVWDNTLGRNMLVQIFAADSVYEDSQQRLALLCDRIRRHEMAAQQCFQLPRTYTVRSGDTALWLVREWIEGVSLLDLYPIDEPPPDTPTIVRLLRDCLAVCAALSALHAMKLQHLRLTPEHIVYQRRLSGQRDRGIVLLDSADVPGTAAESSDNFQAPEQLRSGKASIAYGPETDVYRFGAILYYLVAHVLPNPIFHHPVPLASTHNSAVPRILDEILARSLAVKSNDRYRQVDDLARELRYVFDKLRG